MWRAIAPAIVALGVGVTPASASTVRGRLVLPSGAAPSESCVVELTVSAYRSGGPGRGPGSESEKQRPVVTGLVSGDGMFRLSSVPPGVHTLRAACRSARAWSFVTVGAEPETSLPSAIVLGDAVLTATVEPPLDPSGRPWTLTLSTGDAAATRVTAADAARSGAWSLAGVPIGSYTIDVADHRGTRWLSRPVELTSTFRPVSLGIPRTDVAGRVSFGRQPIAADLVFTDPAGARRVAMESADDGSFAGSLPVLPAGDWTVVLTARRPSLERRLEDVLAHGRPDGRRTWLDLELNTRGATGCVTTERGAPAPGALVTGEAEGGSRVQAVANDDGCFDLGAPAPGVYQVWAESPGGSGEAQEVEIADGWPQALQLVLKGSRRFVGRVVSDGAPVGGASVQAWLSPGVPRSAVGADADGRFEETVPTDDTEVGVTVIAPGYAMKMMRLSLDAPIEIPLTTTGGELTVDVRGKSAASDRSVVLRRDGSVEWLDYLAQWGAVHASASGRRVVLPQIEPGPYTACLVARSELPALWAGDAPADRCASGTLGDGGRLALVLDGAPEQAR